MPAFKSPGLQERQDAATRAKAAALAAYRSRPPIDESVVAERNARLQARQAAEAEKRAAAKRAKEEALAAKLERERLAADAAAAAAKAKIDAAAEARAAAAAEKATQRKLWTEEDRKAARDARYAARKARLGRR